MSSLDGMTIYLLMVNELEQDGHSRDYVRDAYTTREAADAARQHEAQRYENRVSRMSAQQRHRHTMETYSIDEVTLTDATSPTRSER